MSGADPQRRVRRWQAVAIALIGLVMVGADRSNDAALPSSPAPLKFATFERPFGVRSPWNSRPIEPQFGDFVVPKSDYYPGVSDGAWSTGVFLAKVADPPEVVHGRAGTPGVYDPDSGQTREIAIPHWPAELAPAAESDGHAEIVDLDAGVVHSFWQLKKIDGRWTAALYAWSPLGGRGWGDPAHYYQGARAAAVPSTGGLMRKHEVHDGDTMYRHALAMSMTYNGLSSNPTYVFPATSADSDAATTNTGAIPEGALMMLPPSFDADALATPSLKKVARTLKVYGAYVVDRNLGTPYSFYVEIGSRFELHGARWNDAAAADLDRIRQALRRVVATKGWLDADGTAFQPEIDANLLSMRGPWRVLSGDGKGTYETWKQAVVFGNAVHGATTMVNDSGQSIHPPTWAAPRVGRRYHLVAHTSGGGKLRVQLRAAATKEVLFDSDDLADGAGVTFGWPADATLTAYATSGTSGPSTIAGTLIAQ